MRLCSISMRPEACANYEKHSVIIAGLLKRTENESNDAAQPLLHENQEAMVSWLEPGSLASSGILPLPQIQHLKHTATRLDVTRPTQRNGCRSFLAQRMP